MIPKNKHDIEATIKLSEASDELVLRHVNDLLPWLEDVNWPVFNGIVERLKDLGAELQEPIKIALKSNDTIYRGNIIGHLIPLFSEEEQKLYTSELERILKEYSTEDLEEGVIDFVEMQLARVRKCT